MQSQEDQIVQELKDLTKKSMTSSPTKLELDLSPAKNTTSNQNGLLAISTPNTDRCGINKLNNLPLSAVRNEPKKPRVNFHSIEDIVNGGNTKGKLDISQLNGNKTKSCKLEEDTIDDSGFQSLSNITNSIGTPSLVKTPKATFKKILDTVENSENQSPDSDSSNGKKIRTTFTDQQKWMLDQYFRKNCYPDPMEIEDLSQSLNLPESVIKVWFQNKRSRNKQKKPTSSGNNEQTTKMQQNLPVSNEVINQINAWKLISSAMNPFLNGNFSNLLQ